MYTFRDQTHMCIQYNISIYVTTLIHTCVYKNYYSTCTYTICLYSYCNRCIYVSYGRLPFHRWPFSVLSLRTLVICSCISLQLPVPMTIKTAKVGSTLVDPGSTCNMLLCLEIFWGVMGGHEVMNLSSVCCFCYSSNKKGSSKTRDA